MWRIWLLLILAVALQTTWLARVTLWGVHPDLPLLLSISVALLTSWRSGMIFGLAAGLLTGYVAAKNIGSFAFSRLVAGGALGLADRTVARDNILAPPLLAAGGTLLADLIVLIMAPTDFPLSWWLQHTPVRMAMHALLIWPLHWCIARWILPQARTMFS
jgi:rod shape-determining protein MreD